MAVMLVVPLAARNPQLILVEIQDATWKTTTIV